MNYYRKVKANEVDDVKRDIAAEAVKLARKELSLPALEVRWFKLTDELMAMLDKACKKFAGADRITFEDEVSIGGKVHPFGMKLGGKSSGWKAPYIELSAEVPTSGIAFSALHECAHLADFRDGVIDPASLKTRDGVVHAEKRANDFANRFAWHVNRLFQPGPAEKRR